MVVPANWAGTEHRNGRQPREESTSGDGCSIFGVKSLFILRLN